MHIDPVCIGVASASELPARLLRRVGVCLHWCTPRPRRAHLGLQGFSVQDSPWAACSGPQGESLAASFRLLSLSLSLSVSVSQSVCLSLSLSLSLSIKVVRQRRRRTSHVDFHPAKQIVLLRKRKRAGASVSLSDKAREGWGGGDKMCGRKAGEGSEGVRKQTEGGWRVG
jgi:hypothetical protein